MDTSQIARLHAYIDESGQDTLGRLFVVGAVVIGSEQRDAIGGQLEALERRSRKGRVKWHRTRHDYRQAYVTDLANITLLSGSIFLCRFTETLRYHEATAEATAQAICTKAEGGYRVRVVVDGLTGGDRRKFIRMLRGLGVRPDDVRGGREQSNVFIRLADAICGLARDADEGQSLALRAMRRLQRRGLVVEL